MPNPGFAILAVSAKASSLGGQGGGQASASEISLSRLIRMLFGAPSCIGKNPGRRDPVLSERTRSLFARPKINGRSLQNRGEGGFKAGWHSFCSFCRWFQAES